MSNQKQAETSSVFAKVKKVFGLIGLWIMRLRKLILSIPVVAGSLYLARLNNNVLPDMVGLGLQNDGAFAYYVEKAVAINGPLIITAACLLMMFLSRKTLYPWIVALFSMALSVVVLILNVFPA